MDLMGMQGPSFNSSSNGNVKEINDISILMMRNVFHIFFGFQFKSFAAIVWIILEFGTA